MKNVIKSIPKQLISVLFFLNLILFFIPNLKAENIIYGTPYYLQHMYTKEYLTFVNASYNGVTPNCATQKDQTTAPTWKILGAGGSTAKNGTVVKSGDSVTVQIQGTTWANMYLSHSNIYSILQDQYQARLLSSATSTLWKMSGFDSTLSGYVPTATGGQTGWTSNITVGTTLTTAHAVDLWSITYSPLDYCMVSGQFWYTTAGVSNATRKTYPAALEGYGEAHTLNAWYSNLNSRGWKLVPAVITPATPSPTTAFKWQLDTATGNVWFWDKTKWNLASGDTFKEIAITSSGIICALSLSAKDTGGYAVKVRTGATTTNPFGTGWEILNGGYLNTLVASGLYIWGINGSNNTFYINTGIATPSWALVNPPVLLNNTKPLTVDSSGAIIGTDINGTTWAIANGSTNWQMPDLNNTLSAIGTNYTSANLGTSADAWPKQKTLMAIVKYTGFNNINFVNNPSVTNSIYTKIKGFYDTRTNATLSAVKDLLTAASGKKFLSSAAIAPATTSQTADITTWLTNVNNAISETTNKTNFTTALNEIIGIKFLPETDTPLLQKLQALVDNTTYNNLTYLVDYPTTTNSIYTKIDYFYKKRGTFQLTDIKKLLTNAKDKNFLNADQKAVFTTYLTQINKEIAYYTTLKTTSGETSFIFDPSTVTNNTYAAISTAAYSDKWAVTTPNYIEVRFKAEAFSDIHIRFASSTNPTDYIQVIFGGNTNTKSWARYAIGETKTTIVAEVDNTIPTGLSDYWVKISGTTLTYGTGTNTIIGTATIPDAAPKNLKCVGFGGYTQRVFYQEISIKSDVQGAEIARVKTVLDNFMVTASTYNSQLLALQNLVTSVATNSTANTSLVYTDVQAAFWTALTSLHNARPTTDKTKLTALKTWYATLITPTRTKLLTSDKNFTTMNSAIDANIATIDQATAQATEITRVNGVLNNFTVTASTYDSQLSALQTLVTSVATNSTANTSLDYTSVQAVFWTALTNLHNARPTTDTTKLTALKVWYATLSSSKLVASDKNFTTMNSDINANIATIDQVSIEAQLKSDLNAALTTIGTNYTNENIGTSSDAWPTKKTMFAIINNPAFNTTYQGATGGNLIYDKLIGFYDNRATIGLVKLSDGFSGLFDKAKDKAFLSETQKKGISDRIAIIGLEVGLTAAFNTLNSATDKLTAINTFLTTHAADTKVLRAKRAALAQ